MLPKYTVAETKACGLGQQTLCNNMLQEVLASSPVEYHKPESLQLYLFVDNLSSNLYQ